TPAVRRERTIRGAWSSVIFRWSAACQISAPKPLSFSASRGHCSLTHCITGPIVSSSSVTSRFRGPKALKAKFPYGNRLSSPPCCSPTASGKTLSGYTSDILLTASRVTEPSSFLLFCSVNKVSISCSSVLLHSVCKRRSFLAPSIFSNAARGASCCGASASSSNDGVRQGSSVLKLANPTPAPLEKCCQCSRVSHTAS